MTTPTDDVCIWTKLKHPDHPFEWRGTCYGLLASVKFRTQCPNCKKPLVIKENEHDAQPTSQ